MWTKNQILVYYYCWKIILNNKQFDNLLEIKQLCVSIPHTQWLLETTVTIGTIQIVKLV